jgi:hypothetical protein
MKVKSCHGGMCALVPPDQATELVLPVHTAAGYERTLSGSQTSRRKMAAERKPRKGEGC